LTIPIDTERSTSLADFIAFVRDQVDFGDRDSVLAAAPELRALANNRGFLTERINDELTGWRSSQAGNTYSGQTLLLGGERDWFVRANIWQPPAVTTMPRERAASLAYRQFYYYLIPHDHNFSFLTVGYWGPGYETTIYEYDHDAVVGHPGESVPMRRLETTTLPPGKVMFYRASEDIHNQEHPTEFSVSINLAYSRPEDWLADQYLFDFEEHTIVDYVQNPGAGRILACELAAHVGDARTIALLEALGRRHPTPRVRWAALHAMQRLEPGQRDDILTMAAEDEHPLVRRAALEQAREPPEL